MVERSHRTKHQTLRARKLRREASRTERKLWPYLRSSQLGAPLRRQHPIGPYFADLACVPLGLVVEIDGPLHDQARDAERDAFMRRSGFDVMRFAATDVDASLEDVLQSIRDEIRRLQMLAQA